MKIYLTKYHQILQAFFGLVSFLLLMGCNPINSNKTKIGLVKMDSAAIWIKNSKNKSIDFKKRKEFLFKAYRFNSNQKNDLIKNKNLLKIAFESINIRDTLFFKERNQEAQEFSIKIRDTLGIAETHWNYGYFYLNKEKMDSAFYHYYQAYKNYEIISHEYYSAKMLYNMAFIQGRVKDYTGSEISTFQAIPKFEKLEKYLNIYRSYNHLGFIFYNLREYDKAIIYHNKSLEYLKKVKNKKNYKEGSLNDLGLVYQKQGNFEKSIEYFNKALKNKSLKTQNTQHYARLVDNLAYTKFLSGDNINLLQDFNKALKIRDSIYNISGKVISKLHLAEFYVANADTINAILNAKEAHILAKEVNNNRDVLKSLLLLSKMDKLNSSKYLDEYVILSDNLQMEERKLRNKFTRIRFETDEYIEKTEKLSQQKILIVTIGAIVILFLSLLYFIKRQHAKNKELIFEREQQETNQEIYSLMLKQQAKLEEGQLNERHRISEDLHDGVLGKLFGTRLGLGFLNIKGDEKTIEKHNVLIDELQTIEKEIRNISHELKNELFSSQLNFITIVKDLIKNQSKITGFQYSVFSDDAINWNEIDEHIKINCYRIIQEAIQNINKYAKATFVNIDFNLSNKMLKLTIKDNGVGFDFKKKKKGIGLKNMQSRVSKLHGEFTVNSAIGEGTILTFIIPL